MNEEFNGVEELNTTAPGVDEAAQEAKDDRVWTLEDGTEVSKSEFIRHQFTEHNLSRKQISEQFDINYRTVYGATVNMVNDAEPTTRGRSAAHIKINITPENEIVQGTAEEGFTVNDEAYSGEVIEVDRNEFIKAQVEAGVSRGVLAKQLGISYGVVYSITKDIAGASQRHEVEYEGKTYSRSEYIRIRFQEGVSKADIAKELGVDYPVVWSALKSLKSNADKVADAIAAFEKKADLFVDGAAFADLIEMAKALAVKPDEEEDTASAEEAAATEESVYAE
jgi:predicted DNA-binding protein (UPF0251 family)